MYNLGYTWVLSNMVRLKGLEPTRVAAREPKSRMSTNSITGAGEILSIWNVVIVPAFAPKVKKGDEVVWH